MDLAELGYKIDSSQAVSASRNLDQMAGSARKAESATERMDKRFAVLQKSLAALAVGFAALNAIRGVLNVTAQFQKLNAQLVTVTGSQRVANVEFKKLQEFAARTPYQLSEVVNAFVKMKALGLDPSQKALASYGNTAAAMGKSLNQFIEAVADASTSEFERLKEFGIKARQEGEKVTFTFQGVSQTIGNNASEITRYLQEIGENQFAGAMERQANTLDGAWSNLADSSAALANAIGTVLAPSVIALTRNISDAITETASFVEWLGKMVTFDFGPLEESNRVIDDLRERIEETTEALKVAQADKWYDTIHDNEQAAKDYAEQLIVLKAALSEAEKDQVKLIDGMLKSRETTDELTDAQKDLGEETKKTGKAAREAYNEWKRFQDLYDREQRANEDAEKATRDATAAAREFVGELQREADQAGLTQQEIARLAKIKEINAQITTEGTSLTQEGVRWMREEALAAYDLGVARRDAAEMAEEAERELADAAERHAEASRRAWEDFTYDLVDAFEDGTDGVKDLFKRMLADLAKQMLQSGLLQLFGNLFGGKVTGLSGASGQQSLLGSLFSSFGGSSSSGSGIGSLFSGGGSSGGLLGGLFGLFGGGGGAFAGASSAAISATAGAQAAAQAAAGGANAAASSGGFASLFGGGGGGSFAGIPVVGWILAGMALSNSLFSQGWASNGGTTTLPNGATVRGGGSAPGRILDTLGVISNPLIGLLGERAQAIFSGSPAINYLFGRKKPRLTDGETTFGFGPGGVTGSERYRTLEEGGVFRSDRRRWHDFGLSDDSAAYAQGIFDSINETIRTASAQLGSDAEVNFQAAMRVIQKFNKKGEVESTQLFVDVLGRSFAAATEEEALTRLGAEAIIAAIDASMGGVAEAIGQGVAGAAEQGGASGGVELGETILRDLKSAAIRGEASAIAERWRNDAYKLMEGAQFLLSAASDINAGYALLGDESSLTQIADLTEELNYEGETLLQTYERMVVSTKLFDDALELSGITLDKTREEVVRFAVEIAEAAGGLDRAAQLWTTYFNEFFTETELAQQRLDAANRDRNAALSAIGLDPGITNDAFRAAFEAALPDLSPEEIYQWLLAAEAIAAANAAQAAYNQTLGEAAEVNEAAIEAAQDHVLALREARAEYNGFAAGLRREFERMGLNEFQLEMRDIGEWTKENIRQLNELARAAGYAAANEEDLALVHQIAAARAAEAIARLTNSARSLVEQLYGSGDAGATLIDNTQGFIDTALGGISEIGAATNDLYQSQLAAIQNIQAYLDAQLLSDTSSLTPFERLNEARRQFEEMFQRALSGDVDALNDIPGLADILLRLGREYDPSDYPELEGWVRSLLQQLTGIVPQEQGPGPDPTVGGGFGPGGQIDPAVNAINDGTQTISEERAALVAELFEMVRDLMDATGQSLTEVAASIGLNVQDFIRDLGVNLDDLTVETTLQLATIANRLGISLEDLANQVGVDLGDLADSQSLLNQALGHTIQGLPEEDRRVLQPLFDRIANATTAADANAAIAELTAATNAIGGATAAALQPFLDGIVIQTEIQETNAHLNLANQINADQLLELQNIVNELRGTGTGPGLPGPGGGGGGGGLPGTTGLPTIGSSTQQQVTDLLGGIIERLDRVEAATATAGAETVNAISGDHAKRVHAAEKRADMAQVSRR